MSKAAQQKQIKKQPNRGRTGGRGKAGTGRQWAGDEGKGRPSGQAADDGHGRARAEQQTRRSKQGHGHGIHHSRQDGCKDASKGAQAEGAEKNRGNKNENNTYNREKRKQGKAEENKKSMQ